jgi:hypothetical protein
MRIVAAATTYLVFDCFFVVVDYFVAVAFATMLTSRR